ncbi:MAG TPA: TonB-dependent receptor [Thermoanaerobaculia bacterium]|nr:TonB-dependent receptor [Thermoanaerobaculia bacterium]
MTIRNVGIPALVVLLLAAAVAPGAAQTTTATLRGTVTDDGGNALPGVQITAVNRDTGFDHTGTVLGDGSYSITLPPGTYEVRVAAESFEPQTRTVRLLVGQRLDLDFRLTVNEVFTENITVVGDRPMELRTSEVATNVTSEQIENLPQSDRNFLNFAILAPGMRLSSDPFRKEVRSGALPAQNINVFIDGASYKNDILLGGVVGQDASRGNPFPQNAVQEFRVLTQNYKAEYQKSSSAIITALTKSGTNALHGDVFLLYQDKDLVEQDDFAAERNEPKAEYERFQGGLSVGGPIVEDKLHYFFSYERNEQDRANRVTLGNPLAAPVFGQYEGSFTSPFRSNLYFGKLSYQAGNGQLVDLSTTVRDESDVRNFGDQVSFESAEDIKNDVTTVVLKHSIPASRWLNEAIASYQDFKWNPTPTHPELVGLEFIGILRLGGRDTEQDFTQRRLSFRDDLSLTGLDWHGSHLVKGGANVDFLEYDISKKQFGNPLYLFRSDIGFDFPFEARYGVGDPNLDTKNQQYGVYLQDDWNATSRLTFNLGVRWDYETDMVNNDYVTPAQVRSDLTGLVPERYFTDGGDRDPYTSAIQPRLGLSYDVSGKGSTVVFGGWGRYYDRTLYNDILDERFRLTYGVRTFRFSRDGLPRDGQPTILWRPEYLTPAGLNGLIAGGVAPKPEVFLIENGTEPPVSDQWSVGVRQTLGTFLLALTYSNIQSENGFTYLFGSRRPDGTCCLSFANYSNVLVSSDDKQAWLESIYFTADRPYTASSRWGMSLAYTYSDATQNGGDLFSLDFPTVQDYPRYRTPDLHEHSVVISGIVGLPWDIRASTLITLGSGLPYNIDDASRGFGPNEFRFRRNEGEPEKYSFIIPDAFAYRTVDLRFQKDFVVGPGEIGIIAEAFNVFDYENYGCFNGFIAPTSGPPNPNYGKPSCLIEPGRRLQFGLNFSF